MKNDEIKMKKKSAWDHFSTWENCVTQFSA